MPELGRPQPGVGSGSGSGGCSLFGQGRPEPAGRLDTGDGCSVRCPVFQPGLVGTEVPCAPTGDREGALGSRMIAGSPPLVSPTSASPIYWTYAVDISRVPPGARIYRAQVSYNFMLSGTITDPGGVAVGQQTDWNDMECAWLRVPGPIVLVWATCSWASPPFPFSFSMTSFNVYYTLPEYSYPFP